ncbi:hypothetical protein AGMMS49942_16150 [Spirochaetia bacterium]|nr:hypothetical protein AGMMS49942_16150 [Spirochaetia bacterium]
MSSPFTIPAYFPMLLFVENSSPEQEIPEISETGEEKALSDKELKTACFNFARRHFQGKAFRNKSTNQNITVSRGGLGEWKTKTRSRDQIVSIKILDKLLIHGTYWKDADDTEEDPNIDKYLYFRQNCKINSTEYTAIITIRVYKQDKRHKYYHHYLNDVLIKK